VVEVWGARSNSCYETELDIYSVRRVLVYSRFPYNLNGKPLYLASSRTARVVHRPTFGWARGGYTKKPVKFIIGKTRIIALPV
jgi:hypothetical protein